MRISDWSSDVCSSDLQYEKLHRSAHLRNVYRSAFADRPDIQARSAFRQGPSHRRFPIGPAPNPCASGGTSRAHHRSRHLYPAQPLRVSASPRELVSWWPLRPLHRSEEHTSELQSLMRISYAVFCLKKKKNN